MSQLDFIKSHIEKYGSIGRNMCLNNHITRLSGYICILSKIGYEFDTANVGGDYVYTLKNWKKPRQEVWIAKDSYGNVVDSIRKEITMKM